MNKAITIDPAEALRRIITNLAAMHRRKNKKSRPPFWSIISGLSTYGSNYSAHLATSHGFNADTGDAL